MQTRTRILAASLLASILPPALLLCSQAPGPDVDPRIEKLVASVSQERLQQLLTKLVGFGTRNTLSDASSATRGIGAARQWIFD